MFVGQWVQDVRQLLLNYCLTNCNALFLFFPEPEVVPCCAHKTMHTGFT